MGRHQAIPRLAVAGLSVLEQDKGLFRTSPEAYGAEYRQHLLEQYKLFVEAADRVSARRTSANHYLLTVNAFLVTLYGLASSFGHIQAWFLVVPAAGVLVCITWLALIRSYRNLNTAKFKVIHELEEQLPAALFDREWDHAQRGDGNAYKSLTHIEPCIPLVFAALYVILAVCALVGSPAKTPSSLNLPPATTTAARPSRRIEHGVGHSTHANDPGGGQKLDRKRAR